MNIGINLLYLVPDDVGGTETYARELLPVLCKLPQKVKYIVFCNIENYSLFQNIPNLHPLLLPIHAKHRWLRLLGEQILLPIYAIKYRLDLMWSLGYVGPFLLPCPSVVTIHDLNWYYFPESFRPLSRWIVEIMVRLSAFRATHIITDSHASAVSIQTVLKIPEHHVTPILHGAPKPISVSKMQIKQILMKYHLRKPYLFTVLSALPHKNLKTLLLAFAKLRFKLPNLQLVVTGLGGLAKDSTLALIRKLELTQHVTLTGYVSHQELSALYRGAYLFIFPSAYEGFGYPVLEAMSYKIPVVSSNAFSLTEVIGNAGILVQPYDIDGYVEGARSVLNSANIRQSLVIKGIKRVSELQWHKTAMSTYTILRKVCEL